MSDSARLASGKSLGRAEGLAPFRVVPSRHRLRRAALMVAALAAFVAGVAATSAALMGDADPGVQLDATDTTVVSVSPIGYAWRAGIRPGQAIIAMSSADDPAGWRVETIGAASNHVASATTARKALGDAAPVAAAGLIAGALALLFLRTRRRWVLPTACVAVLAASIPLWLEGDPLRSTAVLALSAALPGAALLVRSRAGLVAKAATIGVVALALAWSALRLSGSVLPDQVDGVRGAVAIWGTALVVLDRIALPALAGRSIFMTRPALVDIALIAVLAAVALVLMTVFLVPPLLVGALLAVAAVVVPPTRRRLGRPIEDAFLADVRLQAAAEGAEEERARLARELHDVPLQELAAVIRRLEILPGAEAEREDLRALAGHLRNVATDLRPPVLDDLGLPAALEFLAEETTSQEMPVEASITDDTGLGPDLRPPGAVELAFFRIAREAVGNAVRHSGGTRVAIEAAVAPDRVDLVVADDGTGLGADAARLAARQSRLGLASMRRRAEAVDADFAIDGSARGTTIRVTWQG
jgi:signal transduction histidine kinase